MRPRVLRARAQTDLPSSEDIEEGGFAAGAVTATGHQQGNNCEGNDFQCQGRTEGPASGVLSCFLHRVALRKEEERERGFMDFEIARRQLKEAIGEENVQCAALMRLW